MKPCSRCAARWPTCTSSRAAPRRRPARRLTRDKVQILGHLPLPTGGHKLELVTLNVEDARLFQAALNKTIRVPVGVYAIGKTVGYFIPQGAKPQLQQPVQK